jgi:hypothetical protein
MVFVDEFSVRVRLVEAVGVRSVVVMVVVVVPVMLNNAA